MLTPDAGVYATIPVCTPSDWLYAVEVALQLPSVEALRRRLRVAGPHTVIRAAREWAAAADRRTGRDVAVSHGTVAAAIGYAEATVKRIMRFLSRLGLIVECARGRNLLSLDELAEARALGAEHQRAAASTRALTIPQSVDGTPLPLTGKLSETSHVPAQSPKRARGARKVDAPRRPANDEGGEIEGTQPGRAIQLSRFASQLVERLPQILRVGRRSARRVYFRDQHGSTQGVWVGGRHIGHVCEAIARHRLIERGWTAHQVLEQVDRYRAGMRRDLEPGEQRDPLAWLFWLIGKAIEPDELAPHARADAERQQQRAEAAARRAKDEQLRERIASDSDAIDATIAAMHRKFPSARRPRS